MSEPRHCPDGGQCLIEAAGIVARADDPRAAELVDWADRHAWVARNACQVFAERMRREAKDVRERVAAGEYGRGLLAAARAFDGSATNAALAASELARIMDGPDDEEGATTDD